MPIDKLGMNVKLLSTVDRYGGAGLAARRLMSGLRQAGVSVEMLVQEKSGVDSSVRGPGGFFCRLVGKILPYLDPLPKLKYIKRHRGAWSCGTLPNPCFPEKHLEAADILHLHWICGGFLPIDRIGTLKRPVVWTMHDSWPFSGGCHLPFDCRKYENSCGNCPQLKSHIENDLSRSIWIRKRKAWRSLDLTIVAPSAWMASCAAASSLFAERCIRTIPNGLDTDLFSPMNTLKARESLGLPMNGRYLLYSAMGGPASWEKGGDLMRKCMERLVAGGDANEYKLLLTGSDKPDEKCGFPVETYNLGRLADEKVIRQVYSAADLTLIPSRSESLGYVAIESMACGTPCVAFDHSGTKDVVDHKRNGYLAPPFETEGLVSGIEWLMADSDRYHNVALAAREKVVNIFSLKHVASRHLDLYAELINEKP